ncbi:MAG: hypothetical protein JWL92_220 [Candidatus Nomurabacteria bacterium]|nr:hypothetical protein [Candidatus Nomurabacteria bacterium]
MEDQNKKTAIEFQTLVVQGKIDEAYEKYVDPNGKHHNAYSTAGFESLKIAMKDNEGQFPNKQFVVKNVVGDNDMVAIHSHIVLRAYTPGIIAVHLFKFQHGKIIEMWDCAQAIPEQNQNQDGVF